MEVKLAITSTLNSLQAVGCVTELAYKIASGDLKVSLLITFTLERPTLRQAFKFKLQTCSAFLFQRPQKRPIC